MGQCNYRKNILLPQFFLCILSASALLAATPIADGAEKFLGNIIQGSVPSNFGDYWNQMTVENDAKWGMVESSRDQMSWSAISTAYDYSRNMGFPYKQHTFIWGTQEPGWISGLSATQQKEEVEEWIKAFGEKFPETEFIDVVNEPLNTPPSFRNALGGSGTTGWDWVVTAFEMARTYCPNSKLLINEFEIEYDAKLAAPYLNIIMILKERNLIDGIGIQCHTNEIQRDKPTVEAIRGALDTLASSGLPIYVSELDLKGDDNTQLTDYKRLFPVFWEHPAVRGVTLWGYQGNIWNAEAILIKNGAERPALKWLRSYVDSVKSSTSVIVDKKNASLQDISIGMHNGHSMIIRLPDPETVALGITDLQGRMLYRQNNLYLKQGETFLSLPADFDVRGVYILHIEGEHLLVTRKVVSASNSRKIFRYGNKPFPLVGNASDPEQ